MKKTKEDRIQTTAIGAGLAGMGAIGASIVQGAAAPKVHSLKSWHPAEEATMALEEFKPNVVEFYSPLPRIKEGDIVISNASNLLDKGKLKRNTIYLAADQGNAPNDILAATTKDPNNALGWGTDYSQKAEYVVGTKGLQPLPHQQFVEVSGLPSDTVPVPEHRIPHNQPRKQIALTYGNASQAGTIFGIREPFESPYRRNEWGQVVQPKSKLDTSGLEKILEGLDGHYGQNNYDLEIFTGADTDLHDLLKNKNYNNVTLTQRVPKQEFVNKIFSKDLVLTNPGLNLVSFAKSKYKIPTILINTKEKAPHNANFDENITWFKKQQANAVDLYIQDIKGDSSKLSNAIKHIETLPTHGVPMNFEPERLKSLVSKLVASETLHRNSSTFNRLKYAKHPGLVAAGVGALGLSAGLFGYNHYKNK